nr:MAG TPA: hypothetical protein [Caudoviricetes sp.]DAZ16060.1 MAG TPA: hypothetical protein [Caudoviricetes sp.]
MRLSAGFLSKHGTSSVTERSEPSVASRAAHCRLRVKPSSQ